jgi:hypothetical protein
MIEQIKVLVRQKRCVAAQWSAKSFAYFSVFGSGSRVKSESPKTEKKTSFSPLIKALYRKFNRTLRINRIC